MRVSFISIKSGIAIFGMASAFLLIGGCSNSSSNGNPQTNTALQAPMLYSPGNGSMGQGQPMTLAWTKAADAQMYEVQISTNNAFSSLSVDDSMILGDSTTISTSIAGLASNTTYYWRARGMSSSGESAWSAVWHFSTIIAAPVLVSPTNSSTGQSASLTLGWETAAGATAYNVQVSASSTFSPVVLSQMGLTTAAASLNGLAGNTLYYWEVSATNAAGTSSWSGVWSFTTTGITGDPSLLPPSGYTLVYADGFENKNTDTIWQSQFATWTEGGIYPQMRYTTDTFYTGTHSLTSDSNSEALQFEINPLGSPLTKSIVGVQFYLLAKATSGIDFTVWIREKFGLFRRADAGIRAGIRLDQCAEDNLFQCLSGHSRDR